MILPISFFNNVGTVNIALQTQKALEPNSVILNISFINTHSLPMSLKVEIKFKHLELLNYIYMSMSPISVYMK